MQFTVPAVLDAGKASTHRLPPLRQRADSATRHPAIAMATGAVPETIL